MTPAGQSDGKVFNEDVNGDKVYPRPDTQDIQEQEKLTVSLPVKKPKGQKYLEADQQWLSIDVSRVCQPIETLLWWP